MKEQAPPGQWTATEAQSLRGYLHEHPLVLLEVFSRMPRSGAHLTMDGAACSGQLTEGYLMAIDAIKGMASGEPPKIVPPHPNLREKGGVSL